MPLGRSPWRRSRWLVLAPHPDDETIGAGALVAGAAADGRLGAVAFLTDGSGSHPQHRGIVATRRREARTALHRLAGKGMPEAVWIGWRDARPETPGSPAFEKTCRRVAALLRSRRIDAIAVTAADEPHCDHRAAFLVARRAAGLSRRRVAVFEYRVWGEATRAQRPLILRTAPIPPGCRRHALRAHRSQLSPSMGPGFRLPPERIAMAACDLLHLSRRSR